MITKLNTEDLRGALSAIENSLVGSPLQLGASLSLSSVISEGHLLRECEPGTVALRELIGSYAPCLTDDARAIFESIPVFLHDLPICNAIARKSTGGMPFILIYGGLLHVATFRLSLAVLISNIEFMLEAKSSDADRAKQHLSTLASPAQALSYWFYLKPAVLKNFTEIFCDIHRTQIQSGVGTATLLTALHEFSHVQLGHLDGQRASLPQVASRFFLPEPMDLQKQIEFDADRFAIECIKPPLRMSFLTSFFVILDLISDLECFCLPRSAAHPYVLNRIFNIASIMNFDEDTFYFKRTTSMLEQKRSLIGERDKLFPAWHSLVGDEDIESAAFASFARALPDISDCQRALDTLIRMYDGNDYIAAHVGD